MALEFAKELLGDAYAPGAGRKAEAKSTSCMLQRRTWTQLRRVPTRLQGTAERCKRSHR